MMTAKKAPSSRAAANGKKNGAAGTGKKTAKRQKAPRNAGEALVIAWGETYRKRDKFVKMWESK